MPEYVRVIDTADGIVAIVDQERLPVTQMFDCDGEDCEFEEATVVVAGPDKDGKWFTISLGNKPVRMN